MVKFYIKPGVETFEFEDYLVRILKASDTSIAYKISRIDSKLT